MIWRAGALEMPHRPDRHAGRRRSRARPHRTGCDDGSGETPGTERIDWTAGDEGAAVELCLCIERIASFRADPTRPPLVMLQSMQPQVRDDRIWACHRSEVINRAKLHAGMDMSCILRGNGRKIIHGRAVLRLCASGAVRRSSTSSAMAATMRGALTVTVSRILYQRPPAGRPCDLYVTCEGTRRPGTRWVI